MSLGWSETIYRVASFTSPFFSKTLAHEAIEREGAGRD